jgi:ribonuclease R
MDRLTLTAVLRFGREGNLADCEVFKSVIRSDARLTYRAVRKILVDRDTEEMGRHEALLPPLEAMGKLCSLLTGKRRERGSLDFDLPEPEIILNFQGEAQEIIKAERNFAHQIIEEFMIAANEAIAVKLTQARFPLLYRIHEEPDVDKIRDFRRFAALLGYRLKIRRPHGPREFQRLLEEVRGKPQERLVNTALLRSMKQAQYSDKNLSLWARIALLYPLYLSHTKIPRPPCTSSTEEIDRGRAMLNGGFFPRGTTSFPAREGGNGSGEGDSQEVSRKIHGGKGGPAI